MKLSSPETITVEEPQGSDGELSPKTGGISRRDFLRTATLLGMSAGVAALAAACGANKGNGQNGEQEATPDQEATTAPTVEPTPTAPAVEAEEIGKLTIELKNFLLQNYQFNAVEAAAEVERLMVIYNAITNNNYLSAFITIDKLSEILPNELAENNFIGQLPFTDQMSELPVIAIPDEDNPGYYFIHTGHYLQDGTYGPVSTDQLNVISENDIRSLIQTPLLRHIWIISGSAETSEYPGNMVYAHNPGLDRENRLQKLSMDLGILQSEEDIHITDIGKQITLVEAYPNAFGVGEYEPLITAGEIRELYDYFITKLFGALQTTPTEEELSNLIDLLGMIPVSLTFIPHYERNLHINSDVAIPGREQDILNYLKSEKVPSTELEKNFVPGDAQVVTEFSDTGRVDGASITINTPRVQLRAEDMMDGNAATSHNHLLATVLNEFTSVWLTTIYTHLPNSRISQRLFNLIEVYEIPGDNFNDKFWNLVEALTSYMHIKWLEDHAKEGYIPPGRGFREMLPWEKKE